MPRGTVLPNGTKMAQRRGRLGLTQEELASKAGVSVKKISDIERGKVTTRTTLEYVAEALEFGDVEEVIVAPVIGPPSARAGHIDALQPGTGTESVPASPAPTGPVGVVPTRNPKLVGREDLLRALIERLTAFGAGTASEGEHVVSLQGMPGIGKTVAATAVVYSPDVQRAFADGIHWMTVGKNPDLLNIIHKRCRDLGIPDRVVERCPTAHEAAGRVRQYCLRSRKRVLFVLDDLWQPSHVNLLMMAGGGCATLVTTRLQTIVEEFVPSGNRFRPSLLVEGDALELLKARAGNEVVERHLEACRELVRRLQGLPLALVVAARMLDRCVGRGHSVEALLQDLRERTEKLLSEPAPPDVAQFLGEIKNPNVVALLQKSTDELDDDTFRCFALLGNATPSKEATFDLARMASGWGLSRERAQAVADTLIGHGLMDRAGELLGEPRYYIHDLLLQHAKTLIDESEE